MGFQTADILNKLIHQNFFEESLKPFFFITKATLFNSFQNLPITDDNPLRACVHIFQVPSVTNLDVVGVERKWSGGVVELPINNHTNTPSNTHKH